MTKKTVVVALLLLICLCPVPVMAQESFTLISVIKKDEMNMTRFTLVFSKLPPYHIKTSGQRLELTMGETSASAKLALPQADERLLQILVGQAKDKLMLAFLMRRPPHFVNGTRDATHNRLTLDVHWRARQKNTRPAISASVPGHLTVGDKGGMLVRAIASKYQNGWLKFFNEYERKPKLHVPITYFVAPFPCLALFESVDKILPFEVEALVRQEEWKSAMTALEHVGLDGVRGEDLARIMLIKADIQQRAGNVRVSQRYLKRVADILDNLESVPELLSGCLSLQQLYSSTAQTPYDLLAQVDSVSLNLTQEVQPYFDLFQAEVALAAGAVNRARAVLTAGVLSDIGTLEPRYRLRLADVAYLSGDVSGASEQYAAIEGVLGGDDGLIRYPFSLGNYALSLYRTKNYAAAETKLRQLLSANIQGDAYEMVRYLLALTLIHQADANAGYNLLHQVSPGTVAARLARCKIADLSMQLDDLRSRRRALQDYAALAQEMLDRDGRAEMQFKHALAQHIVGQNLAAIEELVHFLKLDRMSELRSHAQVLLAQLLPGAIHNLVKQGNYYQALILVEQNRDLLIATHKNFDFLLELGRVFTGLEYYDSALRLYLYILDATDVGDKQEQIFEPLLNTLYEQGDYEREEHYIKQYVADYPQGKSFARIFYLQLQAQLALGKKDLVLEKLQQTGRPQSVEINRLAANLAWKNGMVAMARQNIDAVIGADVKSALPKDKLLQAEIMLCQGEDNAALPIYRKLAEIEEFTDQAKYRQAEILLRLGQRASGLKVLQQLVDEGKQSQWRMLAEETLQVLRLKR